MVTKKRTFVADDSGDFIAFKASTPSNITIDNVSVKEVTSEATPTNYSIKEFLSGTTDEGAPIFFRADSQQIQLNEYFEKLSSLFSIVNRVKRGSLMKCFISLDNEDFYELQGDVSKGVSTLRIHPKDRNNEIAPPLAREVKISWRDSSKQLCRLEQSSIIFSETLMDPNK